MFVTPQELLMGREVEYPLSPELRSNLDKLLVAVNKFRAYWGKPLIVTSGYRPGKYNNAANGATKSAHLTCEAVDFRDTDGSLDAFCMQHPGILEDCGLYLEHPDSTPGWTHLQTRSPASGIRVFRP